MMNGISAIDLILRKMDILAYELLNNYDFIFPTKIPNGEYKPNIINVY